MRPRLYGQGAVEVHVHTPTMRTTHSPWLTTGEAADYLRYTGRHCLRSLYKFLKKYNVPTVRRGGAILIARADLDKALIGLRQQRTGNRGAHRRGRE